jgi:hypothetical protein
MLDLLWNSTLVRLKKGLFVAYTSKNAMEINIGCFTTNIAILSPFPMHVRHNYKISRGLPINPPGFSELPQPKQTEVCGEQKPIK